MHDRQAMIRALSAEAVGPRRLHVLRGGIVAVVCLAGLTAGRPRAQACSYATKDPAPPAVAALTDAEASGALRIGPIKVKRGCPRTDPCTGGTGVITIPVAMPLGSTRSPCDFGFEYKVVGGTLPKGLTGVDGPTGPRCASSDAPANLFLAWSDEHDNDSFAFDLSIRALDARGAAGPASVVHIEDTGCPSVLGCTFTGAPGSPPGLTILLVLGLSALAARRARRKGFPRLEPGTNIGTSCRYSS
jgi:MYXO-CTERM domain-containing protein